MIALFRLGRNKWDSCATGASRHASPWDSAWVWTESSEPEQQRAQKGGLLPVEDERDRKKSLFSIQFL